jgi:Arc/MetJ-type ribon-helix-helix transcriptional regulator
MDTPLAPHVEQMIARAVATGLFPSRDAVLEAGVAHLLQDEPAAVPAEHVEAIERAFDQLDSGLAFEWSVDDQLRKLRERRTARDQQNDA